MLLFIIGLVAGIIGGMGIGGGTILIPALIFLVGTTQHMAQSVNLSAFFPTALAALWLHARNKHIRYKMAFHLFSAGALGALIGSKLAVNLSADVLRRLFGIFLLGMGLYELLRKDKASKK